MCEEHRVVTDIAVRQKKHPVHAGNVRYVKKPSKKTMAQIKMYFADPVSIDELTIDEITDRIVAGIAIEPGVCPFSEESRAKGKKGTSKDDFARQSLFMSDIDNDYEDLPVDTPEHIAEVLADHGLKAAFMYETYHSTAERIRFRFAVA